MLITSTAYTLSAIVTIALAGLTSAAAAQSTTQRPYNAMTTNPMTTANCNGLSKTKVKASNGTSSRRSRNGGAVIGNTFRR